MRCKQVVGLYEPYFRNSKTREITHVHCPRGEEEEEREEEE
jgi:hypothetical protein